MKFRTKLLLLTILPIVLITIASLILIDTQSRKLARVQGMAVEQMIKSSKHIELQNYMKLVRTAVDPFYGWNDVSIIQAQRQVANVVNQMTFGDDGYFFLARTDGSKIENPLVLDKFDLNTLERQAAERRLVKNTVESEAFGHKKENHLYHYSWNKPSTNLKAEKLGYSVALDRWDWVIGSGLYLDDIDQQIGSIQSQLQANVQETRKVLLALSVGAVLLTSLFFAFVKFSEQKFADEKLKELTSELVDAQENERKRVSTELHDGISQLLVSARYGLDIANANAKGNKKISAPIEKAGETISTAIAEIRRISMALRPSVLDDMGLAAALKSLAKDFQDQTAIETKINANNVGALLNDKQKTCLYRVAQEALANVAKHSKADLVDIKLENNGSKITLTVTDNGCGLKVRHKNEGHGLRNMRERVESHDGTFLIKSNARTGMMLSAVLKANKINRNSVNLKNAA